MNSIPSNTQGSRLDFLDTLRGVAIIVVFFLHATGGYVFPAIPTKGIFLDFSESAIYYFASFIFRLGEMGVAIFFVISGFCIHLSHSKNISWRAYFIRRFFRIYPPYLIALFFFSFIFPWSKIDLNVPEQTKDFLVHLFLLNNFLPGLNINPSFWSVAAEAQLYLLYPLVLFFTQKIQWEKTILCLLGIELVLRVLLLLKMGPILHIHHNSPFVYWFSWSVGCYLCQAHLNRTPTLFSNQSVILWLLVALVTRIVYPLSSITFLCVSIATAILITKKLDGNLKLKLPRFLTKHLRKIGIYSYGIYLFHQPLFWIAVYLEAKTTPRLNARLESFLSFSVPERLVVFAYCLAIGIALYFFCALFYRFVEVQCIQIGSFVYKKIQAIPKKM